ncbi:TRAP transporter small permease [Polycladidibacter stylochi]|uniref:TRAP transporter small permease n=1 Tax=Polycladidibacter stylochi TaxID=1807766 RepID=UPI0008327656|nr:TRAP transporter small permease [Pseudovibrio stylochi]
MSKLKSFIDGLEENLIAFLLAVMTLTTFSQVVARYGFNSGWGGALEFTRVCFAWLILFGMSYGIKISSHLGVDALTGLFPKPIYRLFAMLGALATLLYAVLLIDASWVAHLLNLENRGASGGAWAYVAKFYKLPIGMVDLRFPEWAQEFFGVKERIPRWTSYVMLPLGLGLLAFRSIQAFWQIMLGKRHALIAAHEAEELVEDNKDVLKD